MAVMLLSILLVVALFALGLVVRIAVKQGRGLVRLEAERDRMRARWMEAESRAHGVGGLGSRPSIEMIRLG